MNRKKKPTKAAAPRRAGLRSDASRPRTERDGLVPVVGIGASAGGVEAASELLSCLPPDTGMAFVFIQHLDPEHPSYLPDVLSRATRMPVAQAKDGVRLEANHVYVIPPNTELSLSGAKLKLAPRPVRPGHPALPIDSFLRSMASDRARSALGVVLSGTASDGTEGLRAIQENDGITFVQEPRTAKFAGMPQSAIAAGVADRVLPVPELARELVRLSRHPFVAPRQRAPLADDGDASIRDQICVLVRNVVGVDFKQYKAASFERRLSRRMALRELHRLPDYLELLRANREEVEALAEDLFVHVTSFFRDPEAFDALKAQVFPAILAGKADGSPVRVWVPGCATGEEAYSIAIAFLEFLEEAGKTCPLQIFASDSSEATIERARTGFYADAVVRDVGEERRRRYFARVEGGYRIDKAVRDSCVFVRHDLARDPPFSKLDLVSCRNVLIYFGAALQKKVITTFHYSLNEPGFLLLGRSENITGFATLFSPVDRASKVFARTALPSRLHMDGNVQPIRWPTASPSPTEAGRASREMTAHADRVLLARYGPPGVIVNEQMDILQFRGRTGPYLEPAPGQPQNNLLKMARVGLVPALRSALAAAKKGMVTVRKEGLRFDDNGAMRTCSLVVVPLAEKPESTQQLFLVLFEQFAAPGGRVPASSAARPARAEERLRAREVAEELAAARASLHAALEEHGRARDELTSSNEELVSANEELQSLNEEHEAAKEELQSANEELTTLNDELQARNAELSRLNSDLHNLLESVHIPILIVDAERRIRRFTAEARSVLNVQASDVGRGIGEITSHLTGSDLDGLIAMVIASGKGETREVRGRGDRWQRLQVLPYTTAEGRTDGAVVSLLDIDELKSAVGLAEWTRDLATSIVEAVQVPLVVLGGDLRTMLVNEAFRQAFKTASKESVGVPFFELSGGAWNVPQLRTGLESMLAKSARLDGVTVERELPGVGRRTVSVSARPIDSRTGVPMVLVALEDVTESARHAEVRAALLAQTEKARIEAERANTAKDQFLATLSHELRTPLTALLTQAQLLRRGLNAEKTLRAAELIERSTRTQVQLVDDLLDVSRIIAGKLILDHRRVELPAVVQSALELVASQAERKNIRIEVKVEPSVRPVDGDPVRLQQVAWNLLVNAIKFTPKGGNITVSIDQVGDSVRLRVADDGSGIEPEFLPHVFDRFAQSDSSVTRAHGGLGLGLAIIWHVVELHGGTVRAESAGRDQGATFTVVLPSSAAPARVSEDGDPSKQDMPPAPTPTPPPVSVRLDGVRVLLVDDDCDARESFTEILAGAGANLLAVGSAAEGRAGLLRFTPDVILSDIAMPGEDGYSFLRSVRALGAVELGIPAIAVSAAATAVDGELAKAAGFDLHLLKPVDVNRLVGAVREMADRRREQATLV